MKDQPQQQRIRLCRIAEGNINMKIQSLFLSFFLFITIVFKIKNILFGELES